MTISNYALALIPLSLPVWHLIALIDSPLLVMERWRSYFLGYGSKIEGDSAPPVGSQLLAYLVVALFGYVVTHRLIPNIQQYTLRKGICGKDLGKRGTSSAEILIPEALGIAPGTIFLVCLCFVLVGYATSYPTKLLDVNSALLSICFMLFLGFTDDVLDWPWRYKLFLPSVASLPLLCCYNGSTSIVVPIQCRQLLVKDNEMTLFGSFASLFAEIDIASDGKYLDLGILYLLYMGMLAVFCTNAINIYAGINGLEAGQSYVIGCFVLLHNLVEIKANHESSYAENHLFSAMIMLTFVSVTLALLGHNWYPASVFVGDTFCYFSGMTFAVVGILGHFSKTLLLFFIPQVINFLWSTPQLFKLVPCPRHRLPAFDASTGKMKPSTFPCKPNQYLWLKRLYRLNLSATAIPNMTVINLCLVLVGPLTESNLCTLLLGLQMGSCCFGLFLRYYVSRFFF